MLDADRDAAPALTLWEQVTEIKGRWSFIARLVVHSFEENVSRPHMQADLEDFVEQITYLAGGVVDLSILRTLNILTEASREAALDLLDDTLRRILVTEAELRPVVTYRADPAVADALEITERMFDILQEMVTQIGEDRTANAVAQIRYDTQLPEVLRAVEDLRMTDASGLVASDLTQPGIVEQVGPLLAQLQADLTVRQADLGWDIYGLPYASDVSWTQLRLGDQMAQFRQWLSMADSADVDLAGNSRTLAQIFDTMLATTTGLVGQDGDDMRAVISPLETVRPATQGDVPAMLDLVDAQIARFTALQQDAVARNADSFVFGSSEAETLMSWAGDDRLFGHGGADRLRGGEGDDRLGGGFGQDTLVGGLGDDTLYGGAGSDTLNGGKGRDHLYGGAGDDLFLLGRGNDVFYGGSGADVFVFDTALSGRDVVRGFAFGEDLIWARPSHSDAAEIVSHAPNRVEVRFSEESSALLIGAGAAEFVASGGTIFTDTLDLL